MYKFFVGILVPVSVVASLVLMGCVEVPNGCEQQISDVEIKCVVGYVTDVGNIPAVKVIVTNNSRKPICDIELTVRAYTEEYLTFGTARFPDRIEPGKSAAVFVNFPSLVGEKVKFAEADGTWFYIEPNGSKTIVIG